MIAKALGSRVEVPDVPDCPDDWVGEQEELGRLTLSKAPTPDYAEAVFRILTRR